MSRITQAVVLLTAALTFAAANTARNATGQEQAGLRAIPAPFVPLEYLVGHWNGQATPKDNPAQRFRGWTEKHTWVWSFAGGKVVGLSLTIDGGRVLAAGTLTFDPARKRYRLEGIGSQPAAAAVVLEGTLDAGKHLVLDSVPAGGRSARSTGTMRLSLWPNANFIRYSMAHDARDAGAVQFTRMIEVGLQRDGESLAAGATASARPKCIVTGGAATMTVSYDGRTYPICCTGCRDEFNENREKYIKKASLMQNAQVGKNANNPANTSPPVRRFDDAFADDVADSPSAAKPPAAAASKGAAITDATAAASAADPKARTKTGSKSDPRSSASKAASRAASLLKLGQNLEKSGKNGAALDYYRRVAKDFPKTAAAKTAAARIKALDER